MKSQPASPRIRRAWGIVAVAAAAATVATAADASRATHVACGEVVTTDVRLDSDLINCPGDGIVVGAAGITIDLHGHVVDGTGASFSTGIDNTAGYADVTVERGTVQEFETGVLVGGGAHGNEVRRLNVRNVTGNGIFLFAASDSVVEHNVVSNTVSDGIIQLNDSNGNLILQNTISAAGRYAIQLRGQGDDDRVERNDLSGSAVALVMQEVRGTLVTRNRIYSNPLGGISVEDLAEQTRIVDNNVSANGGSGIFDNGTSTLIEGNEADANADDGIHAINPSATIAHNRADRNGDLGIEAVPGVHDGGGNRARDNGNPAQCTGVACS